MNRKKVLGIALLIGAVAVLAGGGFTLLGGHIKTGEVLLVLGVIAVVAGAYTFFSRSSVEEGEIEREWV